MLLSIVSLYKLIQSVKNLPNDVASSSLPQEFASQDLINSYCGDEWSNIAFYDIRNSNWRLTEVFCLASVGYKILFGMFFIKYWLNALSSATLLLLLELMVFRQIVCSQGIVFRFSI